MSFDSYKTKASNGAYLIFVDRGIVGIATIVLAVSGAPPYFVPIFIAAGTLVGILGMGLLADGLKGLSEAYREKAIYTYARFAFLAVVASVFIPLAVLLAIMSSFPSPEETPPLAFLGIWIPAEVFMLITALLYKKSFDLLASRSGEETFREIGVLLVIGAFLVLLVVGPLVQSATWYLATKTFSSLKQPSV